MVASRGFVGRSICYVVAHGTWMYLEMIVGKFVDPWINLHLHTHFMRLLSLATRLTATV